MKNLTVTYDKRIIVLVGLPGSGKSTWRDDFLATVEEDFDVISSDDIIEELCAKEGITYTEGFDKFAGRATKQMKQNFREAVNKGRNIIWDQTNMTPKKRRTILKDVPEDYYREVVSFEVMEDVLLERLAKREKETGKHIPAFVIKNMANSYVPPTRQEGFDNVTIVR